MNVIVIGGSLGDSVCNVDKLRPNMQVAVIPVGQILPEFNANGPVRPVYKCETYLLKLVVFRGKTTEVYVCESLDESIAYQRLNDFASQMPLIMSQSR